MASVDASRNPKSTADEAVAADNRLQRRANAVQRVPSVSRRTEGIFFARSQRITQTYTDEKTADDPNTHGAEVPS